MRILVYSANFSPEWTGIGKYSGEMTAWLSDLGHEVRVVAAPPHYPEWRVESRYLKKGYWVEPREGAQVWRVPTWIPQKPVGWARVLHLLSFAAGSLPVMLWQLGWRPEAVLVVAPSMLCAPAALLVSKVAGAASWLHVQDFEIDVAFSQGQLKGKYFKNWTLRLESAILRSFDCVSSISAKMLARLQEKGVELDRIYSFPNWVNIDSIRWTVDRGARYRVELSIREEDCVVLFSGSLGRKQGLLLIPAVAKLLARNTDIVFVICGSGALKEELEASCEGLTNVRQLPLQPTERLSELLSLADIHLLTQSSESSDLVMPSKLTGMLASGRAVIATTQPDTEIAIVLKDCGLITDPENAPMLATVIEGLAADREQRDKLGAKARFYAEKNLSRDQILNRFESDLSAIVEKKCRAQIRKKC